MLLRCVQPLVNTLSCIAACRALAIRDGAMLHFKCDTSKLLHAACVGLLNCAEPADFRLDVARCSLPTSLLVHPSQEQA